MALAVAGVAARQSSARTRSSPLEAIAPIWLAGLLYLLWFEESGRYRSLGWAWLAVFALLAATPSTRSAYLAPAFTWLLAAGAVAKAEVDHGEDEHAELVNALAEDFDGDEEEDDEE